MHREVHWRREEIRTEVIVHLQWARILHERFINTVNNKDNAAVQEIKLIPNNNTSYVTLADPQLNLYSLPSNHTNNIVFLDIFFIIIFKNVKRVASLC